MFPQNRFLLLVPFFYLVSTRMNTPKALLSNLATAWVPGVLIVWWWGGHGPLGAVAAYALGYLAFICVYEIGYFVNDTLGTRHDETPRHRLTVQVGLALALVFVALRVVVWWAVSAQLGAFGHVGWLASMLCLVAVIFLHNTISSSALKAVTFFQMSLLRFVIPVIVILPEKYWAILLFLGMVHFVYPRFITYLDSKGRLSIPERKTDRYGAEVQVLLLPVFALAAVVAGSWLPLLIWGYYLLFQFVRMGIGSVRDRFAG